MIARKLVVLGLLTLRGVTSFSTDAQAGRRKKRGQDCNTCAAPVAAPCGGCGMAYAPMPGGAMPVAMPMPGNRTVVPASGTNTLRDGTLIPAGGTLTGDGYIVPASGTYTTNYNTSPVPYSTQPTRRGLFRR